MAYKVFANGFPLPASDLNNFLMRQSVLVFASSGDRSSQLTDPVEGMLSWLQDSNKYQYYDGAAWQDLTTDTSTLIPKSTVTATGDLIIANGNASVTRLGIGTNGQYLSSNGTTAVWSSIAAGGMTLLASGNLSGTNQINLSSISQNYRNLYLVFLGATVASSDSISVRYNSDTSTVYSGIYITRSATSVANYLSFNYAYHGDIVTGNLFDWQLEIPNYSEPTSIQTSIGVCNQMTSRFTASWHDWNNASAVNAIRVYTLNGNNFTAGTYKLYGVS